jgi:hypothetical protein
MLSTILTTCPAPASEKNAGVPSATTSPGNTTSDIALLDDKKLPSTSNAGERGNRRFRKMRKIAEAIFSLFFQSEDEKELGHR